MATATKTTGSVRVKTTPIGTNGCYHEVTDSQAKATALIGSAGREAWYCTITRYGRLWKHMRVTGTDNPHSVYELCFQLGTRYVFDGHEWVLPD